MNMINVYNTYYVKLYERKVPILMIFYCVYKVTTLTGLFLYVYVNKNPMWIFLHFVNYCLLF